MYTWGDQMSWFSWNRSGEKCCVPRVSPQSVQHPDSRKLLAASFRPVLSQACSSRGPGILPRSTHLVLERFCLAVCLREMRAKSRRQWGQANRRPQPLEDGCCVTARNNHMLWENPRKHEAGIDSGKLPFVLDFSFIFFPFSGFKSKVFGGVPNWKA